jgi:hypothetical protein
MHLTLRFSQQWRFILWSSWLCHHVVVCYVGTNVQWWHTATIMNPDYGGRERERERERESVERRVCVCVCVCVCWGRGCMYWSIVFSTSISPYHLTSATNSDISPVKFWRPSVPGCARQDSLPEILPPLYPVVIADHPIMQDLNHNKRIHRVESLFIVLWRTKGSEHYEQDIRLLNTKYWPSGSIHRFKCWIIALLRLLHHCLLTCDLHILKHFTPSCISI